MSNSVPFTTKELSKQTWGDFERMFGKPGEWVTCWCMYYHRARPVPKAEREGVPWKQRKEKIVKEKKKLTEEDRSHGILVYDGDDPVGWCQYGPREELPRIDAGRRYKGLGLQQGSERLWRITCFCVDKKYRNRGVASFGLKAALESIKWKGGGTVEAYPAARRGALATWFGTVSMFDAHGFEKVAKFGKSNVLMRKQV
ncbi:MAG: GNAT family N-acetyltransferase [Thaumarchaeota archaeon]|nr:GNAT family N-acetyltransferase [Nitrososphaerota archaeon]